MFLLFCILGPMADDLSFVVEAFDFGIGHPESEEGRTVFLFMNVEEQEDF